MEKQNIFEMGKKLRLSLKMNGGKDKAVLVKCSNKRSLEEIFSAIWELEEAHQILTPNLVICEKSAVEADGLRSEGNDAYNRKDFKEALELYNRSIMIAPHPVIRDSKSLSSSTAYDDIFACPFIEPAKYGGTTDSTENALSLGFANRSALLFELKFYKKCIDDIELALRYGYPEGQQKKLEERKQKCLALQMGDQSLKRSMGSLSNSPSIEDLLSSTAPVPPKLGPSNLAYPSLSNAVTVANIPLKGKGLVAVRDISPGEVLTVDPAYSVNVEEEQLAYYCITCLAFCITPLPCPGCIKVIFCSESCRTKGLSKDHWIECIILPTVLALGLSYTNLPYKLLKSYSCGKLKSIHKMLEEKTYDSPEQRGCNADGVYRSSSYEAVHHLCQNKEEHSSDNFFIMAFFSFVITKLLHMSGRYFVDDKGDPAEPTREDFVSTGASLMSHIMRLECNQHTVTDFQLAKLIGSGLFPTASLSNHSCYHSAHHYMFGRILILRAMRPIQAGEEITTSYTKGFADQTLMERKIKLKSYKVNCNCDPCVLKWPIYAVLPMYNFKCITCGQEGKDYHLCRRCECRENNESKVNWIKINKKIDAAVSRVRAVDAKIKVNGRISQNDLKTLCEASELVHRHLLMPCQCLLYVESILLCFFETGM